MWGHVAKVSPQHQCGDTMRHGDTMKLRVLMIRVLMIRILRKAWVFGVDPMGR